MVATTSRQEPHTGSREEWYSAGQSVRHLPPKGIVRRRHNASVAGHVGPRVTCLRETASVSTTTSGALDIDC